MPDSTDIFRLLTQPEGQFLERKSCYDRSGGAAKRRKPTDVATDVVQTLAAFANADGGVLILGVEDDGAVTGVDYAADRLRVIMDAPRSRIKPPLRPQVFQADAQGKVIVVFEVASSPQVHQITDGRYLLRIGDSNMPFPADDIQRLKQGKRRALYERTFVPDATWEDLDEGLMRWFAEQAHLTDEPKEILRRYRLMESYNGRHQLTLAALLLFGRDPIKWHPRAGVDFVKYEGTERKFGAQLNIVKRVRLESPLVKLVDDARRTVRTYIRERAVLHDLFFEERLEYPPFAWEEAIVNAIAHRDYSITGLSVEIWMFDDHLEIRSPGGLVEPVTLERLQKRERIHISRNPLIVRVLTDLGYMRDVGEGVSRMFEVMEQGGLYPPELMLEGDFIFTIVLRNQPIYTEETMRWLAQYEPLKLSGDQKRILAFAREHGGTFTNRDYQRLARADLYSASQSIKWLIRQGIVRQRAKRSRVYQLVGRDEAPSKLPADAEALVPLLERQGLVRNEDLRRVWKTSRLQAFRRMQILEAMRLFRREGQGRATRYVPTELFQAARNVSNNKPNVSV